MVQKIALRIASILLSCTILLAAFPSVHAEQGGAGWSFTSDGTLTLTDVTIPARAELYFGAFDGCAALSALDVPDGATVAPDVLPDADGSPRA